MTQILKQRNVGVTDFVKDFFHCVCVLSSFEKEKAEKKSLI